MSCSLQESLLEIPLKLLPLARWLAGLLGQGTASGLKVCHLLNHQTSLGFPWSTDQTGTHPPPGFSREHLPPRTNETPSPLPFRTSQNSQPTSLCLGSPRQLPSRRYVTSPTPFFLPTRSPPECSTPSARKRGEFTAHHDGHLPLPHPGSQPQTPPSPQAK